MSCYGSALDQKTFLLKSDKERFLETANADVICHGFKAFNFLHNSIEMQGTQEVEPENVVKVFKHKPQSELKSILVDRSKD
mmetsp:Transcript_1051/g.1607  ORF Transcript_1051/g.1607 Transcript_1051/m.1607 type:complete len:81 (+) Transcript_1051:1002-1244(+)